MKITFIKSHENYAYFAADTAIVDDKEAQLLINKGFAKQEKAGLPDDMPAKELLEKSGFKEIDQLKSVTKEEITEIKGIGSKTADEIILYVKEWGK